MESENKFSKYLWWQSKWESDNVANDIDSLKIDAVGSLNFWEFFKL